MTDTVQRYYLLVRRNGCVKIRCIDKKRKILILLNAIMCGVFFLSFMYTDIVETTRGGMTFWDALFSGRIRDFYIMNDNIKISERFGSSGAAIYDFPVYFVFAIWNFPLWAYEKLTGAYALDRYLGLIWAKGISIPFLIGTFFVMVKIGKKIKDDKFSTDLTLLMFASSVMFYVSVLVMGQYDAFCLLFILLGVNAYVSGKHKSFIAWFAVAITFKLFALFVFIPLVLLKEKRLLRLVADLAAGCSFLVFWKFMQQCFFTVSEVGSSFVGSHFTSFIFQSQVGFGYGSCSVFIMLFMLVCMYCYFKSPVNENKIGEWALYVSFLGLSVFFVASLSHPQWSLLLMPFSILLVLTKKRDECKSGMWIETIFSTGLLIAQYIYFYWVFSIKTSVYTLAGKLFYDGTNEVSYSVRNLIESKLPGFNIDYLNLVGGGIFAAGVFFFIYWAHPNTDRNKFAKLEISCDSIIIARMLILFAAAGLLFALML